MSVCGDSLSEKHQLPVEDGSSILTSPLQKRCEIISKNIAKEMIINYHYTHKWTNCRYALGLIVQDDIVGVGIYGYPVGRQVASSISPLIDNHDVLELTRLWINDNQPKNTESWFISRTMWWLKKHSNIRVLIAYSDPMFSHLGIIYQASNWLYQGNKTMLLPGYIHVVKGIKLHQRTCVARYGSIKREILSKIDPNYYRIKAPHKHRYIYILDKENKLDILHTLKHPVLPYPKVGERIKEGE